MNPPPIPAFLLSLALLLPPGAFAALPEVEVLYYVRDPWLSVIGSDSPLAACYADGAMIFLDRAASSSESGAVYKTLRLNGAEIASLRALTQALAGRPAHTDLSRGKTDQPVTQIVFRHEGKLKQVSAAGGMTPEIARVVEFLNFDRLAAGRAIEWRPDFVEVMFWPYEYATDATPWPAEFPGLDSPGAKKRGKDSYSVYLPAAQAEKFREFMKTKKRAALLDGRKWAVSSRTPFPHEIPDSEDRGQKTEDSNSGGAARRNVELPAPETYALKNAVMEGRLELRRGLGGVRVFVHLTQKQSGHSAEIEGPARVEYGLLVVAPGDGAELAIGISAGRAKLRANEAARERYAGRNAVFDGDYEFTLEQPRNNPQEKPR
ncbi:MAG: hypothetical protein LBS70_03945 [Candidatus Accumulibacter sp.]|jgi:hypothetical protein|nr:hypothetical protein [Accumulibacter sp.]